MPTTYSTAPTLDWDAVDRATQDYVNREQAEAEPYLKEPDPDITAIATELPNAVGAIQATFAQRLEKLTMDTDLVPEAKARYRAALEQDRDADVARTVERQHARRAAFAKRANSWTPTPPPAPDPQLLNELVRMRDTLPPAHFTAQYARVLADPANRGTCLAFAPYLRGAHDDPDHRLRGDPATLRLCEFTARLETDRKVLIREGKLAQARQVDVLLEAVARDPGAVNVLELRPGERLAASARRGGDGIGVNPRAVQAQAAAALTGR